MNLHKDSENFSISKNLQDCIDFVIFRPDELKFLNKNNNKYFEDVFNNDNVINIRDVINYLQEFFERIEASDFPLGHKYIDLNKVSKSEDIIDFTLICKKFHEKLLSFKPSENIKYEI